MKNWKSFTAAFAISLAMIAGALCLDASAAAGAQRSFTNPTDAFGFLVRNINAKNLPNVFKDLFGANAQMISSGNAQKDAADRAAFLEAYKVYHAVEVHNGTSAYLIVGGNSWIFPVPVVKRGSVWQFDTEKGRQEIAARAIGRNERMAIQACLAYVDAQRDYFDMNPMELRTNSQYARRIVSSPNSRDGLYWPVGEDGVVSPLGDAFASATAGETLGGKPVETGAPFHGYYYRVLTSQGPAANGGAYDYIVDGKMIGGFALVAFPAEYKKSGVMTFMVNQDGIIYEKNLGPDTRTAAAGMESYNPDDTWREVAPEYIAVME